MKIGFKGFRGFGQNAELVELKDLTILTGKNSSGKSTFIKLLQVIQEAVKDVKSLNELFRIKINTANELIGSKEKLESLQEVVAMDWIFFVNFEFYRDYHEVLVKFDSTKNEYQDEFIRVEKVEIHDTFSINQNYQDSLVSIDMRDAIFSSTRLNLKRIHKKYRYSAIVHNVLQDYNYIREFPNHQPVFKEYEYYRKKLNLTDEILEQLLNEEVVEDEDGGFTILETSGVDEVSDVPFSHIGQVDDYSYLLYIPESHEIGFSHTEIESLVFSENRDDSLDSYIQERKMYNPDFDFVDIVEKWTELQLESILITSSKVGSEVDIKFVIGRNAMLQDFFADSLNYEIEDELDEIQNEIENVLFGNYYYYLAKYSIKIYESYLIKYLDKLKNFTFQSNVRNRPSRSFNIYDNSNTFSRFLKAWSLETKERRNKKLNFLRNNLKRFEIADNLQFRVDNNVGFIELVKDGHIINIIDEGSGTSNLISILLLLSMHLNEYDEESCKPNWSLYSKLIVLEEPESNLHPNLQSKLADLFAEVISNYDVYLLVETHSEYLIRKMQYLVAKKEIEPSKISLNYFEMLNDGKAPYINVRKIGIKKNGALTKKFGSGFFDEADNIAIDLFDIQTSQLN